ncbi:DnaJ domain protein [Pseudomonas amygdali pv. photiniae]|uniref:DnaJ domain protein n=3 Tax=Pseudomonas syringae group genomosp. 2 TaxID=251698 RepID=A0A658K3J4_PSEA0|nr:DnaJ domain protein [Pseudomonas amygdali pv. photiniae]
MSIPANEAAHRAASDAEQIAWVDEQDRLLGSRVRADLRERGLIGRGTYILLFNSAGELCVHRRTLSKAIYPGYWDVAAGGMVQADESYDESAARELEEELGVELGDDVDLNSIDDVTQHIEEKLREQAEQAQSTQQPKKPTASEIRREQEEAEGSQSLREIYRKLASALHPDREQDADERERKTALMQRVNEAYENDNLLALLQMQMEIEQIDQTHIDNITDKRLKHFNRILSEQLRELEDEIHDRKMLIREQFLMDPYEDIRPKTVNAKCAKQLKAIREHLDDAQDELDALTDPKSLKAWLRDQRDMAEMLERVEEFDDMELMDTLFR